MTSSGVIFLFCGVGILFGRLSCAHMGKIEQIVDGRFVKLSGRNHDVCGRVSFPRFISGIRALGNMERLGKLTLCETIAFPKLFQPCFYHFHHRI